MMDRELKKLWDYDCPIKMVFGKRKLWGAHYIAKGKPRRIELYLRGMTPKKFSEILDHEVYHECLYKIKKTDNGKWTQDQEHFIIDMILGAQDDWI